MNATPSVQYQGKYSRDDQSCLPSVWVFVALVCRNPISCFIITLPFITFSNTFKASKSTIVAGARGKRCDERCEIAIRITQKSQLSRLFIYLIADWKIYKKQFEFSNRIIYIKN